MSSDPLKSVNQLVPGVSTLVAECIDRAMSLSSDDRFPTVNEFHLALKADPAWQQSRKLNLSGELDLAVIDDSSRQLLSKCSAEFLLEEQPPPSEEAAATSEDQQVLDVAFLLEEQLPPSEEAAATLEDQQVLDVASSTLIDQQVLASNDEPSDTIQQAAESDVVPLIAIDQQVSMPDVDFSIPSQPQSDTLEQESETSLPVASPLEEQPLLEAEVGIPDILDQLPAEPVVALSKTLDQEPLESVNASPTLDDQQLSTSILKGIELLSPGSFSPPKTSHYDYSPRRPQVDIEMSFSQAGCEWCVKAQEQQNNNQSDTT